jgi:hypothetical protein
MVINRRDLLDGAPGSVSEGGQLVACRVFIALNLRDIFPEVFLFAPTAAAIGTLTGVLPLFRRRLFQRF